MGTWGYLQSACLCCHFFPRLTKRSFFCILFVSQLLKHRISSLPRIQRSINVIILALLFLALCLLYPESYTFKDNLFSTEHNSSRPLLYPTKCGVDMLAQFAKVDGAALQSQKLRASDEAYGLTTWLNTGKQIGWCNSKLADRKLDCRPVHCLHSRNGSRIDLREKPLTVLPSSTHCVDPLGGQRPFLPNATRILVSFIMATHNNDVLASKALLELWRTAQEAPSVQFVVYDDASDILPGLVVSVLHALRQMFGANVIFMRGQESKGFGWANHEAIKASSGKYIALINTDM